MLKVFVSIVIGLIIINIIYSLIPDTGYNKYIKVVVGALLLLFVFGNVSDIQLENSFYEFEEENSVFENKEYRETVNKQLEETVSERISQDIEEMYKIDVTVKTDIENNEITNVTISCAQDADKKSIINFLCDTYNLDVGRITVE